MAITLQPSTLKYKDNQGNYQNVVGIKGDSGVYVGTTQPTDPDVKVWINPDGENWSGETSEEITNIIAPHYTDLTFPIAIGQHCIYNENYYVCTTAIATNEAWTPSHWQQKIVSNEINDLKDVKIDKSIIAPTEASSTTSMAHTAGSYFFYGGVLYVATSDIASGGTITPNTNCEAITLGGETAELKSAINNKIDEPSSEGTSGQVLTTDGSGGRTWTTVQRSGTGNIYNNSYNVSGAKTGALTLSGSTESDHVVYARVEIKSDYEITNVNVKVSPANTSENIINITTDEWNTLSYSGVGKKVIFTVRFSDNESHSYEVRNAISFDQTSVFGVGNELSASVIDQMINNSCFGTQYFSLQSERIVGASPKRLLGVVPRNNGNGETETYVQCSEIGNVQMSSSPNSSWSGWQEIGTYGQPNISSIPIYNKVHGTLETDGMFSVFPLWGAWCVNTGGNTHHGGHLFHGWTTDRQHRLTMVQNIYSDWEAAIFNYTPGGKSEGGGAVANEGKFNRLRIGADSSKGILIDPIYEIVNGTWVYQYTRAYFQCTPNLSNNRVPLYSNSEGVKGDICFDSNYFYICTNTNTWKRFSLSSFTSLTSISADYNPSSAVIYDSTPLNDLKQYLTVTATLSDSSTVTVSDSKYTLSGTLTAGTSAITVSYEGKTTTFNVTVTAVALSSISADYNQGGATVYEDTPLNDLKQYLTVTATYNDSSTAVVSSNDYTLSGTLTAGTSTITVSYGDKTDTFDVTVTAQTTLASISAAYNTSGVKIYEIDSVDILKNNLTVTANYSNGTSVTLNADDYTLSGTIERGTTGDNVITTSYSDKSTTFNVAKSSIGKMILDAVTLPAGYTQLTYIESASFDDGGSRFKTSLRPDNFSRVEYGTIAPTTLASNKRAESLSNAYTRYPAFGKSSSGTKRFECKYCNNSTLSTGLTDYEWLDGKGYILEGFPNIKVDGVTIATLSKGTTGGNNFLWVNAVKDGSENSRQLKYYFMKFYDSEDNLIANYVPCKNDSNIAGMYDTVNAKFYPSSAQPFIAGDTLT